MPCTGCGSTVIAGAGRAGKALLGIDRAKPEVTRERLEVCRACPESTRSKKPKHKPSGGLTTLSQCLRCRCVIHLKAKVAGEKCPLGKW